MAKKVEHSQLLRGSKLVT